MKDNCIVAQSGGPTVAINASLAGVIDGVKKSNKFTRVYGAIHGIQGVLDNNFIDLSLMALSKFPLVNTLELSPAMYLGSCRYKLPDFEVDSKPYEIIFDRFEEYQLPHSSISAATTLWIQWINSANMQIRSDRM